jgi:hypothetical protein
MQKSSINGKLSSTTHQKDYSPLWKKIWRLLRNLNIDLPYDPAIPLLEMREVSRNWGTQNCSHSGLWLSKDRQSTSKWQHGHRCSED